MWARPEGPGITKLSVFLIKPQKCWFFDPGSVIFEAKASVLTSGSYFQAELMTEIQCYNFGIYLIKICHPPVSPNCQFSSLNLKSADLSNPGALFSKPKRRSWLRGLIFRRSRKKRSFSHIAIRITRKCHKQIPRKWQTVVPTWSPNLVRKWSQHGPDIITKTLKMY